MQKDKIKKKHFNEEFWYPRMKKVYFKIGSNKRKDGWTIEIIIYSNVAYIMYDGWKINVFREV